MTESQRAGHSFVPVKPFSHLRAVIRSLNHSSYYHRLLFDSKVFFWILKMNSYLVANINGHSRHSQLMFWDKAPISADASPGPEAGIHTNPPQQCATYLRTPKDGVTEAADDTICHLRTLNHGMCSSQSPHTAVSQDSQLRNMGAMDRQGQAGPYGFAISVGHWHDLTHFRFKLYILS